MRYMYGMCRADGGWYALDHGGRLRVPVFSTRGAAARSRAGTLFEPKALDRRALELLALADETCAVGFWLVFAGRSRGYPLEHAQLALLACDPAE